MNKKGCEEKKKTFTANEATTKKILHQRKFKRYISLKYKPTPIVTVKKMVEEIFIIGNQTYAGVTHVGRNPTRRLSTTNNVDNNHKQNTHQKLRSISPTNWFRRQGNKLSKKPSSTTTTNNYTHQQKINELQEEINKLEHQQIVNEQPKSETAHQTANLSQATTKIVNMASVTNRDQ